MFYVPWEWEVKSPRIVPQLLLLVEWSAPWRLLLLFMVAGAALRIVIKRGASSSLLRRRTWRLLLPLLFAMLVVVPPQAYFRAIEHSEISAGFFQFWGQYLSFQSPRCVIGNCFQVPSWNHMWFVAYLWIYICVLLVIAQKPSTSLLIATEWIAAQLRGWRLLAVPALVFSLERIALAHFFPETHRLLEDWYLHAVFFSGFALGFLLLTNPDVMQDAMRLRWLALTLAIVAYILRASYASHYRGLVPPLDLRLVMAFVYGMDQWGWVMAALGFGYRHLRHADNKWRRYLTEAVFPYYILHQTAIVVFAHELARLSLPVWLEAVLIVLLTAMSCAIGFELVKRSRWLRALFGLNSMALPLPKAVLDNLSPPRGTGPLAPG